jgi:hypothetical protein
MVYTAHKSTSLIDPYSIPQDCGAKHLAKINLLLKKILLRRGIASDKEKINKNKNEA